MLCLGFGTVDVRYDGEQGTSSRSGFRAALSDRMYHTIPTSVFQAFLLQTSGRRERVGLANVG